MEPVHRTIATRLGLPTHRLTDARRAERLPLKLTVVYRLDIPGAPLEGQTTTVDVSSAGVQLNLPQMVSPQTPCDLEIALPDQAEPLAFRGRVAWCRVGRSRHRTTYEAGIAFTKPPTYADPTFALLCRFIATHLLRKHLSR